MPISNQEASLYRLEQLKDQPEQIGLQGQNEKNSTCVLVPEVIWSSKFVRNQPLE